MDGQPSIGVVLAGGASRRFGADKALAPFRGTTLVAWAVDRLRSLKDEGFLIDLLLADRGRGLVSGTPSGIPSVQDGPGAGPAAGILGARAARPDHSLLVLACDLPHVPLGLLRDIAQGTASRMGAEAIVPRQPSGHLEPLCALYSPTALACLDRRVARGEFALHEWIQTMGDAVTFLDEGELRAHGEPAKMFRNVNRPEDLPES